MIPNAPVSSTFVAISYRFFDAGAMYFCEQQTIYGGVFAPLERAQELSINLFCTWRAVRFALGVGVVTTQFLDLSEVLIVTQRCDGCTRPPHSSSLLLFLFPPPHHFPPLFTPSLFPSLPSPRFPTFTLPPTRTSPPEHVCPRVANNSVALLLELSTIMAERALGAVK